MIGEMMASVTFSYSLGIYFRHFGQPNPKRLGLFIDGREGELQTISGHEGEHVTNYATDLLGTRVAERESPGGKQILTSVVDGAWSEDVGGNIVLQSGDQLHVESEREDLFGGQDNYWMRRVLSTRVAK